MHWVQSVSWPKPPQPHGAKCGTAISSAGSNLLDTFQHVNFVPAGSMPDQISPACTTLCWIKYSPSSCHQHKAEIKWQSQYRFCILCSMGRQPCSHPWPTSIYYLWARRSGTVPPQPEDVITQPLFQEKNRVWEVSTFLPDPGLLFPSLHLQFTCLLVLMQLAVGLCSQLGQGNCFWIAVGLLCVWVFF